LPKRRWIEGSWESKTSVKVHSVVSKLPSVRAESMNAANTAI
jgi:hypothetical protein